MQARKTLLAGVISAGAISAVPQFARADYIYQDLYTVSGVPALGTGVISGAGGQLIILSTPPPAGQNFKTFLATGSGGAAVDLTPPNLSQSYAKATDGPNQVGSAWSGIPAGGGDAYLWSGTAASGVDLNPAGYIGSDAYGVHGNLQAGYAIKQTGSTQAFVWNGTAASAMPLDNGSFTSTTGGRTNGIRIVGDATTAAGGVALLWNSTSSPAINLNPSTFRNSGAGGLGAVQIVGAGQPIGSPANALTHAIVWTSSSPDSAVDLNPTFNGTAFYSSDAFATNDMSQVGYGYGPNSTIDTALLWNGTAASAVDLGALLPASQFQWSEAYDIDANGNVFGAAQDMAGNLHSIEWQAVPEPASAAILGLCTLVVLKRRRPVQI